MKDNLTKIFFLLLLFFNCWLVARAQENPSHNDTFFLAKKRGLLGKLGKSISTSPVNVDPVKIANPFLAFTGLIIKNIETVRFDFDYDIDITVQHKNRVSELASRFHKTTSNNVILNNLFFKRGEPLNPYLLADNERFLRSLVYIKDARILVDYSGKSKDSVDVFVLTKDVFSLAGSLNISTKDRGNAELHDENFLGSGTRLSVKGNFEQPRNPSNAVSGEIVRRNIGGSFIDFTAGYKDFNNALSSFRDQENVFYTSLQKPLITPYIPTTGGLTWAIYHTRNVYHTDSVYESDIRYSYYNLDGWFGYSLKSRNIFNPSIENRKHQFVAIRAFNKHFFEIPDIYDKVFDYRFTNVSGTLASYNIFKQSFYKTNFIYGFGISEDIPEGFSLAFIGGFVKKQYLSRPYGGIEYVLDRFNNNGIYSNYQLRLGGYYKDKKFEDIDFLFNVDHFGRLKKLSRSWFNRNFVSMGFTAQANPVFNTPLLLTSVYGLPYFNNGTINADIRTTVKGETVFYNTTKIFGFRFAPFIFGDISLLKPLRKPLFKTDVFSAIGGGVRTRNENLVFGTIELKAHYFPRLQPGMNVWKIDLNSNIRFKFRSSFVKRPDFIDPNE